MHPSEQNTPHSPIRGSCLSENGRPSRRVSQNGTALPQPCEIGLFQTLLADGNEFFRSVLRDILTRHFPFMLVTEAEDGDHALALDAELHPQLIFMDIKLPDRSGLELTRQIKSSNPGVLVCLVTQCDIPEYRAAAWECGADHVIVMDESSEAAIVEIVKTTLSACLCKAWIEKDVELRSTEDLLPELSG